MMGVLHMYMYTHTHTPEDEYISGQGVGEFVWAVIVHAHVLNFVIQLVEKIVLRPLTWHFTVYNLYYKCDAIMMIHT